MKYLSKEEMMKLNTKRLLAYKRAHFNHYRTFESEEEQNAFDETFHNVYAILATREHIERKKRGV